MPSALTILHRKKPLVFSSEKLGSEWSLWATCLRSLALSLSSSHASLPYSEEECDVYRGQQAYQFLLEIICGLHSPILGETEVFGQFKAFTEVWMKQQPQSRSLVQSLFADAKQVRQLHLSGLGSQSYGSWVRKCIEKHHPIHLLGSGQLAQDILPWILKDEVSVNLYCRDYGKALLSLETHSDRLKFFEYSEAPFEINGVLIVCAPLSAQDIKRQFKLQEDVLVIDLRDDSHVDQVIFNHSSQTLFHLKDVFAELECSKSAAMEKTKEAREKISSLAKSRFLGSQVRPFGWDDLCA